MAVSKRLRYEILRRDGRRCRYCGDGPPDVVLTVVWKALTRHEQEVRARYERLLADEAPQQALLERLNAVLVGAPPEVFDDILKTALHGVLELAERCDQDQPDRLNIVRVMAGCVVAYGSDVDPTLYAEQLARRTWLALCEEAA